MMNHTVRFIRKEVIGLTDEFEMTPPMEDEVAEDLEDFELPEDEEEEEDDDDPGWSEALESSVKEEPNNHEIN